MSIYYKYINTPSVNCIDFASSLIDTLGMPAHIKDAATKKYLTCNQHNLAIYGASNVSQIIGQTVDNLDTYMNKYWGDGFAKNVSLMDEIVIKEQQPLVDDRIILAYNGLICKQHMIKLPILKKHKTIAIFTFSKDLTNTLSFTALYQQYKTFYNVTNNSRCVNNQTASRVNDNKKNKYSHQANHTHHDNQAIKKFLQHLRILTHFLELPTDAQLKVLITSVSISRSKILATTLGITEKTIEAHLLGLRNKLKIDLLHILTIMRNYKY